MNEKLYAMLGEWRGEGTTTIEGLPEMKIVEHLSIRETDNPDMLAYVRRSRIENFRGPGQPPVFHDELGYMGKTGARLLLSRGSYVVLEWNDHRYEQDPDAPSPDTREMFREVSYPAYDRMRWLNEMLIKRPSHGGEPQWIKHGVDVTFVVVKP